MFLVRDVAETIYNHDGTAIVGKVTIVTTLNNAAFESGVLYLSINSTCRRHGRIYHLENIIEKHLHRQQLPQRGP